MSNTTPNATINTTPNTPSNASPNAALSTTANALPNVTFVTGYFDVARREGSRPMSSEYIQEAKWLLAKPLQHLVIYTEKAIEPELRPLLDPERHTLVIKELEELPLYARRDDFAKMKERHPWMWGPCLTIVYWSKFDLLRETIARRSNSTHFAWIDFGIRHSRDGWSETTAEFFRVREDKIKLMVLRYSPPTPVVDHGSGLVAAGYMSGSAENMLNFCGLMARKFDDFFSKGLMPIEERGIHEVMWDHGELFVPYFGQYVAVLSNYDSARVSIEFVISAYLLGAYEAKDWRRAAVVGDWLWEHYLNGTLSITLSLLGRFLDNYFIILYYLGAHNRAREVKEEYLRLTCVEEFRSLRKEHETRIAANFAFV